MLYSTTQYCSFGPDVGVQILTVNITGTGSVAIYSVDQSSSTEVLSDTISSTGTTQIHCAGMMLKLVPTNATFFWSGR